MTSQIKIVDLFAGPGGLGEGFSAFSPLGDKGSDDKPFRIIFSAEKDPIAHRTLRLRSFYRQFSTPDDVPECYYEHIAGITPLVPGDLKGDHRLKWELAEREALHLTLGEAADNAELDKRLATEVNEKEPWILIGGPPCQAYSLVGRSRNRGIANYAPEADNRHFLYREYLRIIQKFRPSVFVMENVKGIRPNSMISAGGSVPVVSMSTTRKRGMAEILDLRRLCRNRNITCCCNAGYRWRCKRP